MSTIRDCITTELSLQVVGEPFIVLFYGKVVFCLCSLTSFPDPRPAVLNNQTPSQTWDYSLDVIGHHIGISL